MPDARMDFARKLIADDPNIDDATLAAALKVFDSRSSGPRKPAAAEDFMTPEDIAKRDMTVADIGIGAAKALGRSAVGLSKLAASPGALVGGQGASHPIFQRLDSALQSSNPAQDVGGYMETAAELAVPVTKAANAIPSAARAGQKFQQVMGAARNVPIDPSDAGTIGLRIMELAERGGGSMPRPVSQFLQWVTNPQRPDMTYEVARDFASGISRLSANEMGRMSPSVAREVANLRVALNQAVGRAANQAGKGREYAQAMTEYAKAMRLRKGIDEVIEGAKRGVPLAGAAAGGAWITHKLWSMMGGK